MKPTKIKKISTISNKSTTSSKLKHENSYWNSIADILEFTIGFKHWFFESKIVKGNIWNPNQLKPGQRVMLNTQGVVRHHPSDAIGAWGGSRPDCCASDTKILCLIYLDKTTQKPFVVPIYMNEHSRYLLMEPTKMTDIINDYGSYQLK